MESIWRNSNVLVYQQKSLDSPAADSSNMPEKVEGA